MIPNFFPMMALAMSSTIRNGAAAHRLRDQVTTQDAYDEGREDSGYRTLHQYEEDDDQAET